MICAKCRNPMKVKGPSSGPTAEYVCPACGYKAVGSKEPVNEKTARSPLARSTVQFDDMERLDDEGPSAPERPPQSAASKEETPPPIEQKPVPAEKQVSPPPEKEEPAEEVPPPPVPKKKAKGPPPKAKKKTESFPDISKIREEVVQLATEIDALENSLNKEIRSLRSRATRLADLLKQTEL
ncbi:MAG TPA: hypothetical protein VI895_11820 [Bdellovibrionota bacterium]|nr:hypothetical protein [Bdellovibrionota bacterium]